MDKILIASKKHLMLEKRQMVTLHSHLFFRHHFAAGTETCLSKCRAVI